jgi:hypothetical protein
MAWDPDAEAVVEGKTTSALDLFVSGSFPGTATVVGAPFERRVDGFVLHLSTGDFRAQIVIQNG